MSKKKTPTRASSVPDLGVDLTSLHRMLLGDAELTRLAKAGGAR